MRFLGFRSREPRFTKPGSVLEMRLTIIRKHQHSLIRLTSPRTLCVVLREFLFSSFPWSTTRFESVPAAPSRYEEIYPPHNAVSLVSHVIGAKKREDALQHTMRQMLRLKCEHKRDVAGSSTSSQIQRSENATIPFKGLRQRMTVLADISCIRGSTPSANIAHK